MENAKGRMFLLVVGIIMIIFGAIGVLISLIGLCVGGTLNSMLGETGLTTGLLLLSLISAVLELVVGILGVAYSKKPEKAMVCIVLAIIYIVLSIIANIISGSTWGIILGLILPVLYLIGGFKNKQSVQ